MTQFAAISRPATAMPRAAAACGAPTAASPGRGARPGRRRTAAASTGSGGRGSPTAPAGVSGGSTGGTGPRGRTPRTVGACRGVRPRDAAGRRAARHASTVQVSLPCEQPRQVVIVGVARRPRPRRRRRPARAPGRRTSAAATSRKMPIGTCAMLGSSRRESANAVDGSSAATSWRTMRAGSAPVARRPRRAPRSSARTTTGRRRPATGSPSVEVDHPGLRPRCGP